MENSFSTETYINTPSKAFGGNEEVVLKKKWVKGRQASDTAKNVYTQRSSGLILPEYRLPTKNRIGICSYTLVEIENTIFTKAKKYPWSGQYTFFKRQYREINCNFKQGKGDYGGITGMV